jgi:hypothetical protein
MGSFGASSPSGGHKPMTAFHPSRNLKLSQNVLYLFLTDENPLLYGAHDRIFGDRDL